MQSSNTKSSLIHKRIPKKIYGFIWKGIFSLSLGIYLRLFRAYEKTKEEFDKHFSN